MWDRAFLEQARSDWDAREIVRSKPCAACHELHYLQMAAEKLGKAVLLRSGTPPDEVNSTHKTFVRFLKVAPRHPGLQEASGKSARQLREYVATLSPIADQIERLAPALAQSGPNAEYPWRTPSGAIVAPASYEFTIARDLQEPHGRKLLALLELILEQFDGLF